MDEWKGETLSGVTMMAMIFWIAIGVPHFTVFKVGHQGLGRKQMVHLVG